MAEPAPIPPNVIAQVAAIVAAGLRRAANTKPERGSS